MFLKIVLFTSPKYDLANLRKFGRLEDSKLCTLKNYASGFSSFAYCSMWHIALKIPYSLLFHLSIINLSHACFARVNVRKGILCGTRGQMLPGVRLTVWSIQRQHILVVAESYSCEISQGQRRMQNAQTSVYCLSYGKGKQMCVFVFL